MVWPVRRRDATHEGTLREVPSQGYGNHRRKPRLFPRRRWPRQAEDLRRQKEIPWPEYYQGHGWESDYSQRLGIDAIPTVFLVDQKGKLVSLDAGDKLERLILELMNRTPPGVDGAEGR